MKVLIPEFLDLPTDRRHDYRAYRPEEPIPEEHHDADVLVLWGNKRSILSSQLELMPHLRLLQTLSAGYDHILERVPASRAHVPLCCGVGLHNRTVAEYCLMMMLVLQRDLIGVWQRQQRHEWPRVSMRNPLHTGFRAGAHVLICGFGSIGQALARLLQPLGLRVSGIARTSGERQGVPTHNWDELPRLLPSTDVLVNVLPGGPATRELFNLEVFSQLPSRAFFINAGRGSSVHEDDLVTALRQGLIAAAALDVVQNEPLPATSPLWDVPNLLLTPHIAGMVPEGWQELLHDNLERLDKGQPLINLAGK